MLLRFNTKTFKQKKQTSYVTQGACSTDRSLSKSSPSIVICLQLTNDDELRLVQLLWVGMGRVSGNSGYELAQRCDSVTQAGSENHVTWKRRFATYDFVISKPLATKSPKQGIFNSSTAVNHYSILKHIHWAPIHTNTTQQYYKQKNYIKKKIP